MLRRPIIVLVASTCLGFASYSCIASGGQSGGIRLGKSPVDPVDLKLDGSLAVKFAEVIFVKVYRDRVLSLRPCKVAVGARRFRFLDRRDSQDDERCCCGDPVEEVEQRGDLDLSWKPGCGEPENVVRSSLVVESQGSIRRDEAISTT